MSYLNIFLSEWRHLRRSPYKVLALLLFVGAAVFGLSNGQALYEGQSAEIARINSEVETARAEIIANYYQKGIQGPEDRPWVDYMHPYWALNGTSLYHFKKPNPAYVYNLGQSENYGYYKKVGFWSSAYDPDMVEEIANPERLQMGTLDFSFTVLFLMPLVLLVLLYNLKSFEEETGFLRLISVQFPSIGTWLFTRMFFYFVLLLLVLSGLVIYGSFLTPVSEHDGASVLAFIGTIALYTLFWFILYFVVLWFGRSIWSNALVMSSLYLLITFIIPASVHQSLSIKYPPNLMTELIDVREEGEEIYTYSDEEFKSEMLKLFPELERSAAMSDSSLFPSARRWSVAALRNEIVLERVENIIEDEEKRNAYVQSTMWFNPLTYFQNRFNEITQNHFTDYLEYRIEIQTLVNQQIETMIRDTWDGVQVDEARFNSYLQIKI